jgi:hypothetical protein
MLCPPVTPRPVAGPGHSAAAGGSVHSTTSSLSYSGIVQEGGRSVRLTAYCLEVWQLRGVVPTRDSTACCRPRPQCCRWGLCPQHIATLIQQSRTFRWNAATAQHATVSTWLSHGRGNGLKTEECRLLGWLALWLL